MSKGVELIARERQRQIDKEGWSAEHDDDHSNGEIVDAAVCYAYQNDPDRGYRLVVEDKRADGVVIYHDPWPWSQEWDKREKHGRLRRLQIAGALIAAEIDRLIRADGEPG